MMHVPIKLGLVLLVQVTLSKLAVF